MSQRTAANFAAVFLVISCQRQYNLSYLYDIYGKVVLSLNPTTQKQTLKWLPITFILLQSTLYGFGDPISKAAYEVVPLYSLLSARYTIAFLFLMVIFGR